MLCSWDFQVTELHAQVGGDLSPHRRLLQAEVGTARQYRKLRAVGVVRDGQGRPTPRFRYQPRDRGSLIGLVHVSETGCSCGQVAELGPSSFPKSDCT